MTTPTTTRMTAPRLARLIADGDVEAVRAAVQDSPRLLTATVERDGQGGWTPLHLAVAEGRTEVVRLLVEASADLSARTSTAGTRCTPRWSPRPDWSRCCASWAPRSTPPAPP